jgi:hypothetical protein
MTMTACCCGCFVHAIAWSTSAVIDTIGDGVSACDSNIIHKYFDIAHVYSQIAMNTLIRKNRSAQLQCVCIWTTATHDLLVYSEHDCCGQTQYNTKGCKSSQ